MHEKLKLALRCWRIFWRVLLRYVGLSKKTGGFLGTYPGVWSSFWILQGVDMIWQQRFTRHITKSHLALLANERWLLCWRTPRGKW